jgi:hypothetical protein
MFHRPVYQKRCLQTAASLRVLPSAVVCVLPETPVDRNTNISDKKDAGDTTTAARSSALAIRGVKKKRSHKHCVSHAMTSRVHFTRAPRLTSVNFCDETAASQTAGQTAAKKTAAPEFAQVDHLQQDAGQTSAQRNCERKHHTFVGGQRCWRIKLLPSLLLGTESDDHSPNKA